MDLKTEIREYFYKIHGSHIETDIANIIAIAEKHIALQLQQTGVSGCFSYKEALEFLQLHTPIAVKPIKKSKYKFVQPFTSKNARDIVIFSLATELSKNNR